MGATPPDNYLIVQPVDPWNRGTGQGGPDDDDPDGWPYWKPFRLINP
jgi:hypothetical protein